MAGPGIRRHQGGAARPAPGGRPRRQRAHYTVRRAAAADASALVRLLAVPAADWQRGCERLAAALAGDTGLRCWVAEHQGGIVGTMAVRAQGGADGPAWLIESIFIEDGYRRRGVTRLLLAAVGAAARLLEVDSLTTLCLPPGRAQGACLLKGRLY